MNILERKILGFRQTVREFIRNKTNWAGVSGITVAAVAWHAGTIDAPAAVTAIFGGLSLLFMRDAVHQPEPPGIGGQC